MLKAILAGGTHKLFSSEQFLCLKQNKIFPQINSDRSVCAARTDFVHRDPGNLNPLFETLFNPIMSVNQSQYLLKITLKIRQFRNR